MWKTILALALSAALAPVAATAAHHSKSKKAPAEPVAEAAPAATPVPELRFEPQLTNLDKKVSGIFGADTAKQLRLVAEAAVLTDYCAAVNLDQKKFKDTFEALAMTGAAGRKPAEQRTFEAKLAMYYGVYVGLLVAEGTERRAEFCGFAESALKEQRPISQYWIPTAKGAGTAAAPAAGVEAPVAAPSSTGIAVPAVPTPSVPAVSAPSLPAAAVPAVSAPSLPSAPSVGLPKAPKLPGAADVPAAAIPKP